MKFANPLWFAALVPAAIWAFFLFKHRASRKPALHYSDAELLKPAAVSDSIEDTVLNALKVAAVVLMIVALARPQKISKTAEPPKPVVDIILCLDTSMSMAAIDFDPQNRLDMAKKAAEEFIRKRPMDRLGLVVFGGRAIAQCPLTLDHESLIEFLRSIPLNATQSDGTAIGTALAQSSTLLAESEAKTKVIILLTDGRSNTGNIDPVTAAGAAADLGVKIYAIGTAVPGGGVMPVEDPIFGKRMIQTAEDLDEPTLLEVSRVTGAKYFRVTSAKRFKEIYDEIDRLEKTKVEALSTSQAHDAYMPILLLAFLLMISAATLEATVWRTVP